MSTEAGQGGEQMSGDPTSEMAPGDEAPPGTPGAGENICAACENCEGTGVVIEEIGGA